MNTNNKIAIYLPSLRGGGAERVMVTLANGFAECGHSVDLVLAHATGPYLSEVAPAVHVEDLGCTRVATSLLGLMRYLRDVRPEAILSAMGHANVIALLAVTLAQVSTRVVVSERNDSSVESTHARGLRSRLIHQCCRLLYRKAHHIHAVSAGVADAVAAQLSIPRERIQVVYNPVDTDRILELSHISVDYPWLQENSTPLIAAAGRLTRQKDFMTLIRAFAKVRMSRNLRLVIMGEGELRAALEAEIIRLDLKGDVLLPGFIENPFAVMRRARLFVLSSAWEGLPNVLIQAMACGTPVVATDCPSGPAEILEHGKWGRLLPVGDVDALAEAIAMTLNDKHPPDVTQRAAYFSIDRAVTGYLRLLQVESQQ